VVGQQISDHLDEHGDLGQLRSELTFAT
jgi:hypothetical protein